MVFLESFSLGFSVFSLLVLKNNKLKGMIKKPTFTCIINKTIKNKTLALRGKNDFSLQKSTKKTSRKTKNNKTVVFSQGFCLLFVFFWCLVFPSIWCLDQKQKYCLKTVSMYINMYIYIVPLSKLMPKFMDEKLSKHIPQNMQETP